MSKKTDVQTYQKYESDESFSYVMPGDSKIVMQMPFSSYFQTRYGSARFEGSLSDAGKLDASDLIAGRLPEQSNEIVVDKMVLDSVIDDQMSKSAGYGTPKSFIDGVVPVNNMPDFVIVGVSDMKNPCIYASRDVFINLLANTGTGEEGEPVDNSGGTASSGLIDYSLKSSDVTLTKGSWPVNDYEVIVNEKNKEKHAAEQRDITEGQRDKTEGDRLLQR